MFRRGAAWDQLFVKWRNICSWSTISTCVTDGRTVVTRGTVCYVWDGLYRAALALLLLTSLIKWGNCMLQFCGIKMKTWLHFMHEYDLVREFDWGLFVSAIQWAQLGGWVTTKLFPDNPLLCPVLTIIVYLSRTKPPCSNDSKFFISFVKPHKSVNKRTLARWVKQILLVAGVDIFMFASHAVRGVSVAFMRDQIIYSAVANWSNKSSVFQ